VANKVDLYVLNFLYKQIFKVVKENNDKVAKRSTILQTIDAAVKTE